MQCHDHAGIVGRAGGVHLMSCGTYKVKRRNGEVVGTTVMDDAFAEGFSTMERVGDHPCPGEPEQPGRLAKVLRWLKAEASTVLEGELPEDKYQARLEACRSCDRLKPGQPLGWCGACGCGTRRRAELTIKAKMPAATCPLGLW